MAIIVNVPYLKNGWSIKSNYKYFSLSGLVCIKIVLSSKNILIVDFQKVPQKAFLQLLELVSLGFLSS